MNYTLRCFNCNEEHDPNKLQSVCRNCAKPLRVDLHLMGLTTRDVDADRDDLWKFARFLPSCEFCSLGEGCSDRILFENDVWIQDESRNPTASFKARGMAVAVAMAKKLGAKHLAVPSAGNAAAALAAYAKAYNLQAHVFMPRDTPRACIQECYQFGADVGLIDGLITACATEIRNRIETGAPWFDMSTLKEPYRVEGKKTMGYDLFLWRSALPDAIIYPTGGGTGLIGIWKALDEMEKMGWIGERRPKMISVQAEGCCPIVNAFHSGERFAKEHTNAYTIAAGLRVPRAIGDFIILDLIRESKGTAIAVSDEEMIACAKEIRRKTGVFACPEGGATLAAYRRLVGSGFLSAEECVVLVNTGSGAKCAETMNLS